VEHSKKNRVVENGMVCPNMKISTLNLNQQIKGAIENSSIDQSIKD